MASSCLSSFGSGLASSSISSVILSISGCAAITPWICFSVSAICFVGASSSAGAILPDGADLAWANALSDGIAAIAAPRQAMLNAAITERTNSRMGVSSVGTGFGWLGSDKGMVRSALLRVARNLLHRRTWCKQKRPLQKSKRDHSTVRLMKRARYRLPRSVLVHQGKAKLTELDACFLEDHKNATKTYVCCCSCRSARSSICGDGPRPPSPPSPSSPSPPPSPSPPSPPSSPPLGTFPWLRIWLRIWPLSPLVERVLALLLLLADLSDQIQCLGTAGGRPFSFSPCPVRWTGTGSTSRSQFVVQVLNPESGDRWHRPNFQNRSITP